MPAEPSWLPGRFADERTAWRIPPTGEKDGGRRVEAAALRGRPIEFVVHGPWMEVPGQPEARNEGGAFVVELVLIVLLLAILGAGVLLAIRNVRLGRGDRAGARRLSIAVVVSSLFIWILDANHASSPSAELNQFFAFVGQVLLVMALFLMVYLALEPYVRRTWPERIVGWSRLLTGRLRDPLVGRDLVVGGMFFLAFTLVDTGGLLVQEMLGIPPRAPALPDPSVFLGTRSVIGSVVSQMVNSAFNAMFFLLLLLFLRIVCRRATIAVVAYLALFVVFVAFQSGTGAPTGASRIIPGVMGLALGGLFLFALLRFGLLAFMVAFFFDRIASGFPLTLDMSRWWAGSSITATVVIVGLTAYGVWIGVAGQGLFRDSLLDERR
jgi:serine/threonine-protein kinase